jgi:spore coat polysaccharide biosynthesis predicted glycosyltransferase SpsG
VRIGLAGEFSALEGLGHFFRLKGLFEMLSLENDVVFFFQDALQREFLENAKVPYSPLAGSECDRFIYDGRKVNKIADTLDDLRASDKILIDCVENSEQTFGKVVVPSFFITDRNYRKMVANFEKHYFGSGYFYLRSSSIVKSSKPIVTFGGSDPNNITLKVAEILGDQATYLLGPLYRPMWEKILKKIVGTEAIVNDARNTYSHLVNTPLVISALGTTLQEVELLKKSCLIIANYESDREDFKAIKSSSSQPDKYLDFFLHNEISKSKTREHFYACVDRALDTGRPRFDLEKHNAQVKKNWQRILE